MFPSSPFVTVVSGLPRSGTSLMMQMLQAGGLDLLTDGRRMADEHNPRGYFEYECVKNSRADVTWVAHAGGRAVKVIHILLRHLPADRTYRVVFMLRDLREVLASQRAMLNDSGRSGALITDERLADVFARQLAEARQWLAGQANFRVLYVEYGDVLRQPLKAAQNVAAFLGGELDAAAMAGVVDRGLYRQRLS
ncbi:MAG TPA: sulfotransferase [Candidatus Acidoferrum sp.]|nr:sulfotransferase [Candidatus Acidoferrum sp.]